MVDVNYFIESEAGLDEEPVESESEESLYELEEIDVKASPGNSQQNNHDDCPGRSKCCKRKM